MVLRDSRGMPLRVVLRPVERDELCRMLRAEHARLRRELTPLGVSSNEPPVNRLAAAKRLHQLAQTLRRLDASSRFGQL